MTFIKKNAEAAAKEQAASQSGEDDVTLQKHRWTPVKLIDRKDISEDTKVYTFHVPDNKVYLGLGTCQHVQLGFHMKDRMLIRSYTPTRPLLPPPKKDGNKPNGNAQGLTNSESSDAKSHRSMHDGDGTFDLTVKTYFPNEDQPGGAMSNTLDCLPLGEEIEIRGPTGEIVYNGNGEFEIEGSKKTYRRVSLVLGGSGITPGYALIARILMSQGNKNKEGGEADKTEIRVIDANKSEKDILLREDLDEFEKNHGQQIRVAHVLSHPSDEWKGIKGHVNEQIIKENLFEPGEDSAVFLCGPPAMIQKAAMPALKGAFFLLLRNKCSFSLMWFGCVCADDVCRLGLQGR